jgi:uncharacterized protein YhbP (UPF0306 family)
MDVEKIVRENIAKTFHLSLGTCFDNKPWVSEVHFAYDDQLNLYFRSKPSRRHSQEITANPLVSGDIVQQFTLEQPVVGVYFEGSAVQLQDVTAESIAYRVLSGRMGMTGEQIAEAHEPDGHKFYKISVCDWHVFGRFGAESGQKYSITWGAGK